MQTINLLRALKKAGYTANLVDDKRKQYLCTTATRKLEWYDQDGTAICVHSSRLEDRDNLMTDDFPGYFCTTIRDAVKSLT